ncbi:hypothetical protein RB2150_14066 [Rhodobacteraceae bacterium HTCC2150]|nr:hypothetical protein RB2150_14066 [Rhodobacteraceae bacterium HTCC2150]
MTREILFDPLFSWPILAGLMIVTMVVVIWAKSRGLSGWGLRGLGVLVVLLALANPSLKEEDRNPLSDIVVVVSDETASQSVAKRPEQMAAARTALLAKLNAMENVEIKETTLRDGEGDQGSLLIGALRETMATTPKGRLAGAFLLSDGQVHDADIAPEFPAPVHVLLSGEPNDWDRRLVIKNAPAFAILGEEISLTLLIEDQGDAPDLGITAPLQVSIDGAEPLNFNVEIGREIRVPLVLSHAGMNILQFTVKTEDGELTDRNNTTVVQINGVRDRLRVLLVSGQPHAGERTWRNLLKSDSAVDLVHFTILRPPEKQDGVPISELSLIAFPTQELFMEKIHEFDLIIFDRYRRRGLLPSIYLNNVRNYIESGGAVLIAAGPDFATAESLYRSPLGDVLPGEPTSIIIEEGYKPQISELGARHPVTAGLEKFSPNPTTDDGPGWGRWFRLIELGNTRGHTVMTGPDEKPLLVLDRVGEGRVALLASDHAWLWGRGYEGGGPQLELLRRLAHWMMKEPELEEDVLTAIADGQNITITRRMIEGSPSDVTITAPNGATATITLSETAPGVFSSEYRGSEMGLFRVVEGDKETVIALGPAAPKEFEQTIATGDVLAPIADATNGGVRSVSDGVPNIRKVRAGRVGEGRGWLGITPRGAYETADVRIKALLPMWLMLLAAAGLFVAGWLREGRR